MEFESEGVPTEKLKPMNIEAEDVFYVALSGTEAVASWSSYEEAKACWDRHLEIGTPEAEKIIGILKVSPFKKWVEG